MRLLIVLNDAPYGSERTYNGLRLAGSAARRGGVEVRLFLIGDAAACAKSGQKVPPGCYNVQTMLASAIRHGAAVGVCGTCMDARGIADADLIPGARRSTMDELTQWALEAERALAF
jgi:uncharacterized protein involved in oxidation of intracellular sulfur